MTELRRGNSECDADFGALIDQLFVEETLPAPTMERLRGHVAGCDGCRAHYNRVVLAARLFDGGPEAINTPSALELDRVREAVLARARLAPEPPPKRFGLRSGASAAEARRSAGSSVPAWLRWIGGLAAVGAALAIVLPLALDDKSKPVTRGAAPGPSKPEFQTRGAAPKQGKLVGLRAFCASKAGAVSELGGDNKRCTLDSVLQLAYTNRSTLDYVFIVGVDAAHRLLWYVPTPRSGKSVRAERGAVDKALARTVRLAVNHHAGALRIFALFSDKPLDITTVQAAVAKTKGRALDALELLPVEDTEQRSLLVTLETARR